MDSNRTKKTEVCQPPTALIRSRDVKTYGMSRSSLANLVKKGRLVLIGRGLYANAGNQPSELRSMAQVAATHPATVVCLLSALQFHGLTTQIPFELWIAIGNKARPPSLTYPPVKVLRFSNETLNYGLQTHLIDGVEVRITDIAKTVADCFKFRNKVGLDVALEALQGAWRSKTTTMDELWRAAKVCRVSNVIRPYLESLV